MIDLYTWGTPNGQKASIMLEELGLSYRVTAVDISKGEQHDPEFRKISPNGKIPALVDHDAEGTPGEPRRVFESGNILIYLAEKSGELLPASGPERTEVLGWLFFQIGHLGPMVGQWHWFKSAAPVESEISIIPGGITAPAGSTQWPLGRCALFRRQWILHRRCRQLHLGQNRCGRAAQRRTRSR